ncbi:MAG: ribosome biogenesis GTPase Der [Thermoanaerobaculia bacterium]
MSSPTVAIVGRPNVGKSTLFNRLLGRRQAIVDDLPGATRDRVSGLARVDGRSLHLVDTGGLLAGDDVLGINRQVLQAIAESDLVLLVVDGSAGLLPGDQHVEESLRPFGKPTVLVVNKGDTRAARDGFHEFSRLGVEPRVLLSAEHGQGLPELRQAILERVPLAAEPEPATAPRLAIVGRPNVGKSSILNRLVGEERALVAATPGTTRDPVDSLVMRAGRPYLWVDTAGIRRRGKTADSTEALAVLMASRQVEAAEIALLVIDAAQGVTSGDLSIAGSIRELGRAAVLAVNKWDLLDEPARARLEASWGRLDDLLGSPRRVNVSAATGRGLDRLYPAIDEALTAFRLEVGTAELNRVLERALAARRPPSSQGRPWKLYYATQVTAGPPTFMLFANRSLPRTAAYRRYLERSLREALALRGVPVRLVVRRRASGRQGVPTGRGTS